jgi:Domain of unknown function (DUF4282)
MAQQKGFFARLFDFSFSEFIAIKIVGIVYALYTVIAALVVVFVIFGSFSRGFGAGLGALIIAPLAFLLYTVLVRVGLESLVASIRTSENTRIIAENTRPNNTF